MKKNLTPNNGLSLSQAQSISNLCNQRCIDIAAQISECNNSEKAIKIDNEVYIETKGKPIPKNIIELLKEKSTLHATQAFLMENIKAKDSLLKELQQMEFIFEVDKPEYPEFKEPIIIKNVNEQWGWDSLTMSEYNEFLESESFASHIGQFIHKGGQLDKLRNELPKIKTLEFIEIKNGEKTPLVVKIHHTSDELLSIHEELAGLHREYEQKVNYYKAKVKNMVTQENARIAQANADSQNEVNLYNNNLQAEYNTLRIKWEDLRKASAHDFEKKRFDEIKKAAELRISVDPRFQPIIDKFLNLLK